MKIITEFCQNHNGDFEILKKMINEAAEGGATHGKIQTIFAEDVTYRERFENGTVDSNGKIITIKRPYKDEYDRLKNLEVSYEQHRIFIEECKKVDLIPLTTAFTKGSVPKLKDFGFESIKVASYDCGALPLVKLLAESFNEIIISTGATYNEEIEATANYLNSINKKFSLLHCVTIYPTPLEQIHLKRMKYLKKFTDSVGLSEHTMTSRDGVKATLAAIYYGAEIIERHFSILPAEETRDGKVSIKKEHVQEIVKFSNLSKDDQKEYIEEHIPEYDLMLGSEQRELSDAELLNRDYYRGRFASHYHKQPSYNWEV